MKRKHEGYESGPGYGAPAYGTPGSGNSHYGGAPNAGYYPSSKRGPAGASNYGQPHYAGGPPSYGPHSGGRGGRHGGRGGDMHAGGGRGSGGRGGPAPVAKGAFQLDLPLEPNILQEVNVTRRLVGKIIGPGGETATQIRKSAHCFLHVRKETRPDDTQVVEISGSAAQIKAGLDRLMDIIKDEITEDPKLTPHVSPSAVTYFDVMPEMIGYVLGSRGATVKMLRAKTSTDIQVTDASPETGLQAITIKGAPDRVQDAYQQIRTMLEKYDPRRGKGPPPGLLSAAAGGPPAAPPHAAAPPPAHAGYEAPQPHYGPPVSHVPHHAPPPSHGHGYEEDPYRRGYQHQPAYASDYPPPAARDPYGRPVETPASRPAAPPAADPYGRPAAAAHDHRAPAPHAAQPAHTAAPVAAAAGPPAVIQAAGSGQSGVPQFLVLHADGTYRPAQLIMNVPGKEGAHAAATAAPAASSAAAPTAHHAATTHGAASTTAHAASAAPASVNAQTLQQLLGQVAGGSSNPQAQQLLAAALAQQQAAAAAQQTQQQQTAASAYAYQQPAAAQAATAYAQPTAYAGYQQPAATSAYPASAYDPQQHAASTAAATATTAAGTAAATSGLTLQQLHQYYNSYAALYQQAQAQQPGAAGAQGTGTQAS